MNVHLPTGMSVEEFASWVEHRPERYELVEGMPRLLPNVRRNHSLVSGNLHVELALQLDRTRYAIHQGDLAIRTSPDTIRYADVMIEETGKPGDEIGSDAPLAIFEVLSNSTMHEDFGAKKIEYLALPSLLCFVILSQDEPQAWLWQRDEKGEFPEAPELIGGAGSVLPLPLAGAELTLGALYRGVTR